MPRTVLGLLLAAICATQALILPASSVRTAVRHGTATMLFGFGKPKEASGGGMDARERDFQARQGKLAARQQKAATQPKGAVECTFPQKGNKVVAAKQGEPLAKVVQRAGLRVKFDCKVRLRLTQWPSPHTAWPPSNVTHCCAPAWRAQNGRCGTCQVRLNGRQAAKICQGAKVPGGATRKLSITLDN
jgi:ferredoxin